MESIGKTFTMSIICKNFQASPCSPSRKRKDAPAVMNRRGKKEEEMKIIYYRRSYSAVTEISFVVFNQKPKKTLATWL